MTRVCKNYFDDGGDTLVITGKLTIDAGATVEGVVSAPIVDNLESTSSISALSAKQGKVLKDALDAKTAANQAASTASDVAGIVADFNALLAKLKAAGLMAADA